MNVYRSAGRILLYIPLQLTCMCIYTLSNVLLHATNCALSLAQALGLHCSADRAEDYATKFVLLNW